jgi:hypothetical protein
MDRSIFVAVILALFPCLLHAQELSAEEAQRAAPYYQYWELVDSQGSLRQAQMDFAGRGTALAQHFLHHIQASPGNTAFFFLFRAVGDVETARLLIQALLDPPTVQGLVLGRDPGELSIAIEAVLGNENVRTNPAIFADLDETIRRARSQLGGARVAQTAISLLGKCRTSQATQRLQTLAADPDPMIRAAALEALGNTGSFSVRQTLERNLAGDTDPEARARAAVSLAQSQSPGAAASLQASLRQEKDPRVIDASVGALARLHALPQDPRACLEMANRTWDPSVAQPLFDCWRATATRDLILQAASGGWTVRALALRALAEIPQSPAQRDRLLKSSVEVLSQNLSGLPVPNSLSYSTAQLAREALWNLSGQDMAVALPFVDRIVPGYGHSASAGRYGESYDLAHRDPRAYVALRRPWQLVGAAFAALLLAPLAAVRRLRKLAVAMLASVGGWAVWSSFQTDIRELPPPPLFYLTVSCLAFLSAGLVAGLLTLVRARGWMKVAAAPFAAGICAFVICGFTRSASLFPIGSEGWELIFDPLASALLAAPAALLLSLATSGWGFVSLRFKAKH